GGFLGRQADIVLLGSADPEPADCGDIYIFHRGEAPNGVGCSRLGARALGISSNHSDGLGMKPLGRTGGSRWLCVGLVLSLAPALSSCASLGLFQPDA